MNESDLNRLLQQALAPKEFPSDQLNQTIRNRVQEEQTMKRFSKKRPLAAALVAALVLALSITGFASWRFLSAGEAAEHSGMSDLARAFESGDAVSVNQTVASGNYTFSFLGIASGENLSGFQSDSQVNPKRTYAVLAIAKTDGTAMAADGSESFFVSPLIKGQKPWQVNITTMNGGYTEFAEGGVLYRLIECDDIEMFADRGLYLCVSTSDFYDKNAFTYDEETGEITTNPDYSGACALFDLPLDPAKADRAKADAYLETLLEPWEDDSQESSAATGTGDWADAIANGTVVPGSEQAVTYDEDGMAHYSFGGYSETFDPELLLGDGSLGPSSCASLTEDADGTPLAICYYRNEQGVVMGKAVRLQEFPSLLKEAQAEE